MDRPKPPPPPPRPDLGENGNGVEEHTIPVMAPPPRAIPGPPSAGKRGPPPIPSRPDLEEEHIPEVQDVPQKKAPPSVPIKKKTGSIRSRGRPQITIISAQPMGNDIPPPSLLPRQKAAPEPAVGYIQPKPVPPSNIQPKIPLTPLAEPAPTQPISTPHHVNTQSPSPPQHPQLTQDNIPFPTPTYSRSTAQPTTQQEDAISTPLVPSRAGGDSPQISTYPTQHTTRQCDAIPTPHAPTKADSDSPQRPVRKSKGRTPPQRPKSKPVCDIPMLENTKNLSSAMPQPMKPMKPEEQTQMPLNVSEEVKDLQVSHDSSVVDVIPEDVDPVPSKKTKSNPSIIPARSNGSDWAHNNKLKDKGGEMDVEMTSNEETRVTKPIVIPSRPAPSASANKSITNEDITQTSEAKAKPPPPAKKPKPSVSAKPQLGRKPSSDSTMGGMTEGEVEKAGSSSKAETLPTKPKATVSAKSQLSRKSSSERTVGEMTEAVVEKSESSSKSETLPTKPKAKPTVIIPPKRKVVGSSTFFVGTNESDNLDNNTDRTKVESGSAKPKVKRTVIIPKSRKVIGISNEAVEAKEEESRREVRSDSPAKTESPPVRRKTKPTVIIPKNRKVTGSGQVKDVSQSEVTAEVIPDENVNAEDETKSDDAVVNKEESKASKPRKEPRIIRPKKNKAKGKDMCEDLKFEKNTESVSMQEDKSKPVETQVVDRSRGSPEGESQENTTNVAKKAPNRIAPTRTGLPKSGPARPAPPRPSRQDAKDKTEPQNPKTECQQQGSKGRARPKPPKPFTSESEQEVKETSKAKAPRPATIGKERDEIKEPDVTSSTSPPKGKPSRPNAPVPTTAKASPAEPTMLSSVQVTKIEPSAIALFDYDSGNLGDLIFQAGDEIILVQRVDKDWYIGRCGDQEGMMPVSFVEVIEDLPLDAPKSNKIRSAPSASTDATALYTFTAESEDELSIWAGDTIQLLEFINDDWIKGALNGQTGIFPASFIEVTQELKAKLSAKKPKHIAADVQPKLESNAAITSKASSITSGPRCRALYDYPGDAPDDLTFVKDDVIRLEERIGADWLRGELHGMSGMFPAAYVGVVEDLPPVEAAKPDSPQFPVVTALYDYASDVAGDLSFSQGDPITVMARVSDQWLEGEVHGKKGIFPAAFVDPVDVPTREASSNKHDVTEPSKPNKKLKSKLQDDLLPKARALYNFQGEEEDELTFKAGDTISLLRRVTDEWVEGELDNRVGRFPVAFVEILVPLP